MKKYPVEPWLAAAPQGIKIIDILEFRAFPLQILNAWVAFQI